MFGSFDEAEFGGPAHSGDDSEGPAPPDSIDGVVNDFHSVDSRMSEAERRLALAGYYKQLTRQSIFNDGSEEARLVDQEVREFALRRMDALIGIQSEEQTAPPVADPQFTEEQADILRQVADRMLQRNAAGIPAVPQVHPVAAPAAPTPRRITAPPTLTPAARATRAPQQQQAAQPHVPPRGRRKLADIPLGEVFTDKGQQYKFVENPEQPGSRIKMNVTGQIRNPAAMPMPGEKQMELLSEQQAVRDVNAGPLAKNQQLLVAAAKSVTKGA